MVKIAVLGYGTVGLGVVEIIERNADKVKSTAGEEVSVKYVLDLLDFPGDPVQEKVVHDIDIILKDEEVSVVVETLGGTKPAYKFVSESLKAKKSVCTSNKELVADYGPELIALAKENGVSFLFEASVGGGIPILRSLTESLTADEVESISGILNGTTNYILTKMSKDGSQYEDVLKEAQELGYAEKDPTADVEGYDACRKIAILTSLAYGKYVDFKDIYTEGITKITSKDFEYAKKLGMSIKIFGMSSKDEDGISAMVAPVMIDENHPLYAVNDVFNAIVVKGNMLGDVMFYGKGAGKLPTASAVVSDVVEIVKNKNKTIEIDWTDEKLNLNPIDQVKSYFFVRLGKNDAKTKEAVHQMFGDVCEVECVPGEYAFTTNKMKEKDFEEKIKAFDSFMGRIRVMKA